MKVKPVIGLNERDIGDYDSTVRVFAASHSQRSLWFLAQLSPTSSFYNLHVGTRLRTTLDTGALERSINNLVGRHEILRTAFRSVDGEPMQVVTPALVVPMPVTDLRGVGYADREAAAEEIALVEAETPFDLASVPLLRTRLVRLDDAEWVWLLTLHHIVGDYWSLDLLLGELSALYSAELAGISPALPELPIQYADYAEWERVWLQGSVAQEHVRYWKNQLRELPTLRLPYSRTRSAEPTFEGATWEFEVPPSTHAGLSALARSEQATMFMVTLAAFQTLLHRCSGQDDIAVGTPIANRDRGEVGHVIGMFANSVVLRTDFTGNPTFTELLGRVRTTVLEALDHQDLPFEVVVSELSPSREAGENPLFNVHFQLLNEFEETVSDDPLSGEPFQPEVHTAKFDLALDLWNYADRIWCALEYSTDVFSEDAISRFCTYFSRILEEVAADPDTRVATLAMVSEVERHRMIHGWNATSVEEPCVESLFNLATSRFALDPDGVAVTFRGRSITNRELEGEAERVAERLGSLGVGQDDLVAIYAERSPALIAGLLGALRVGAGFLLLSPTEPRERLRLMLASAAPKVALVGPGLAPLPPSGTRILRLTWVPGASAKVVDDTLPATTAPSPRVVRPESLAYVMYTSGSTGRPKGVAVEQRAICNHLLWMQSLLPLLPEDRVLLKYPVHVDAFLCEMFGALIGGATLVIPDGLEHWDPEVLAATLDREAITVLDVVPSMLEGLLNEPGFVENDRLRRIVVGGEALRTQLRDRCLASLPAELHNIYGPTEATIGATCWQCRPGDVGHSVPIGRPGRNTRIYVLDRYGEPTPIGVIGEIHIGGEGVARGYLDAPDLTAARFVPDTFADRPGSRMYKTGDLGRFRPDGALEFVGRLDDQLKLRGNRVEVGEIEEVLAHEEYVKECAVVPIDDGNGNKRPVAYVVPTRPEPELWPSLGEYDVYDEFLYYAMTHDRRRTDTYRRAIQRVADGKVVVDVGTGADAVLARLCVDAGAKRVYAIEQDDRAYRHARAKVHELGLTDRINVIRGNASTVQLPEFANLCVSEILGTIGSSEGVIPILNDARRFLTETGTMIPWRCETRVAAVRLPSNLRDAPHFGSLASHYARKVFSSRGMPFDLRLCITDFPRQDLMSDSAVCELLDFTSPIDLEAEQSISIPIVQQGELDGFLLWVTVSPDAVEAIDALEERSSWLPVYFPVFSDGVRVVEGDEVEATFTRTVGRHPTMPDYRLRGEVRRRGGDSTQFDFRTPRIPESSMRSSFHRRLIVHVDEETPEENGRDGSVIRPSLESSMLELPVRLRRYLQSQLPSYMLPSSIVLLEQMPVSASGKIDRVALASRRLRSRSHSAAAQNLNATEQVVASVWSEVLNLEQIGTDENFFDLGGDSILIVQVRSQLESILKSKLSIVDLFRYPTVGTLADYLGAIPVGGDGHVETAERRAHLQRAAREQRRQRRTAGGSKP
jgi:amino acid adenylation domain-containing protein